MVTITVMMIILKEKVKMVRIYKKNKLNKL